MTFMQQEERLFAQLCCKLENKCWIKEYAQLPTLTLDTFFSISKNKTQFLYLGVGYTGVFTL